MRKRPRPDQIAAILRRIQADLQAGLNINQACRKGGIGLTTYYRWKALQENPISSEQLRISELDDEAGRLKQLVAELALDRRMLQEALKKLGRQSFLDQRIFKPFEIGGRVATEAPPLGPDRSPTLQAGP
jgi:putative transposase